MNILITSAARKVTLVQAFQKALKDEGLDGFVVAADMSPNSPALKFATVSVLLPPTEHEEEYNKALLSVCGNHSIDLIIPTRDEELPFYAHHKHEYLKLGIWIAVPDEACVSLCQDKIAFAEFCEANGVEIPKRIHDITGLPIFIRARYGWGGGMARRADTMAEVAILKRKWGDCLVQENIDALEYTVDVFSDSRANVLSVIPRQRIKVVAGESVVGRTEKNADIIRECQRLAGILKLQFHSIIQCFYDNRVVKFIEVNPRYGGASNLSFQAGGESPRWLIQLVTGREVTAPPVGEFLDNLTMLRYSQDIFIHPDDKQDDQSDTQERPSG